MLSLSLRKPYNRVRWKWGLTSSLSGTRSPQLKSIVLQDTWSTNRNNYLMTQQTGNVNEGAWMDGLDAAMLSGGVTGDT